MLSMWSVLPGSKARSFFGVEKILFFRPCRFFLIFIFSSMPRSLPPLALRLREISRIPLRWYASTASRIEVTAGR